MIVDIFNYSKLEKNENGYTLIVFANPNVTEFSKELGESEPSSQEELQSQVVKYAKERFPNVAITTVKVMVGTLLVVSIPFYQQPIAEASGPSASYNEKQASYNVEIMVNGERQQFRKAPRIINGTTFVPIRGIAELVGGTVWWNGETRTVGVKAGDKEIAFIVGSTRVNVNGEAIETEPSFIDDGTTLVPIRLVSEEMGLHVEWDGATKTVLISSNIYEVQQGDTLWGISQKKQISVERLKEINNLSSEVIFPGQTLYVKERKEALKEVTPSPPPVSGEQEIVYRVQPGDSLSEIANKFSTSINEIKTANQLNSDIIYVGQLLHLKGNGQQLANTITYTEYSVQSGDNAWNLSVEYGVPMYEILEANNLTENSALQIGQIIKIPVHHIAVQETVSERHGEYLDWWTEAQYVFPIGKVATVTDFHTGKSFQIKRTVGANHADCEPLTYTDNQTAQSIWGGYSWSERPVIVEVDGRQIAASMSYFPHDVQYITDNGFNGHFDIHFKNSTRHMDGKVTEDHQENIRTAAGVSGY